MLSSIRKTLNEYARGGGSGMDPAEQGRGVGGTRTHRAREDKVRRSGQGWDAGETLRAVGVQRSIACDERLVQPLRRLRARGKRASRRAPCIHIISLASRPRVRSAYLTASTRPRRLDLIQATQTPQQQLACAVGTPVAHLRPQQRGLPCVRPQLPVAPT